MSGPLLDREGRRFGELGLGYLRMDEADVLELLLADEAAWRSLLAR